MFLVFFTCYLFKFLSFQPFKDVQKEHLQILHLELEKSLEAKGTEDGGRSNDLDQLHPRVEVD